MRTKNKTPEIKELSLLKTIILCIGMVALGGALAFAIVVKGVSPKFLTDQDCNALQEESFINGTSVGEENTIATITDAMIQCKTLQINYREYKYTLVAVECLNITN